MLTVAQVQAGAHPGESLQEAWRSLQAAKWTRPPFQVDEYPGADYTLAGPLDECEGLDGQAIEWEPGEMGPSRYP
ncbi:hypothetical protein [Pseudomonas syringae]|uniref:hypothetical protein n=1 Tax=Pseudomonas syringae TaxID=317 RepID=UPI001F18A96E|nr:hypothetical protein [Pseudomonas syringae]